MDQSKHRKINQKKWDAWADTLDNENWRNEILRRAQGDVVSMLDLSGAISLLDVGCGTGWALGEAARRTGGKGDFWGVDMSPKMIEKAKENFAGKANFHFLQATADAIPLGDSLFDSIICTNSFHHYLHPEKALREMHRLLKPGGKVLILDPVADTLLIRLFDVVARLIDRAHVKIYSTEEFKQLMNSAGFAYSGTRGTGKKQAVHMGTR